jgi:DNA-directed RNA polymerase specialized sigma24 family protein
MCSAVADIEACIPALRLHASALLRDRQDVDDLVRACLARSLEVTRPASDHEGIRLWLLAIMYGQLASRSWRARLRRAGRQGGGDGPDALRDLGQLAERQRAVLLLVTIEDLAYAEVARVLGISVAEVMSLLADSRERLRRLGTDAASTERRRME